MLDEAHERTLYTDIAIGLLKKVIFFFFLMFSLTVFIFSIKLLVLVVD